jgi:hypothetical protein
MFFAGFAAEAQYTGEGATVTTSSISGSAGTWNSTSDAVVDNDTRAVNSTSLSGSAFTDHIVVTNFGLSVPTSETISGVEFIVNKSKSGGTWAWLGDYSVVLVKAGSLMTTNNASVFPWGTSDADYSYGGNTEMWGTTITPTDVNNTGFGVAMASQRYFGFGSPTPRIDNVSVVIHTSATLPVELTYFGTENNENDVNLNWVTNSEVENDYFMIQASKDGFTYQTIGQVGGQGNTAEITNYQFVDQHPSSGITYYRLKQVDFDGTTAYTDAETVNRGVQGEGFVMFPNPAINAFSVSNLPEGINTMNVTSLNGQHVLSQSITNYTSMDLTTFESGIYIVSITNSIGTSSQKLVVR